MSPDLHPPLRPPPPRDALLAALEAIGAALRDQRTVTRALLLLVVELVAGQDVAGRVLVVRAVDAAFAAHARTGLFPSRKSVRELAAAALYGAIDAEISRRLARHR